MSKILIFQIKGDYACFKKFYTTSSILTFDFPPKTSLLGLLGAVLGFKRRSKDLKGLNDIKLGIQLLNPVNKIHQGINWLNTKVKNKNVIEDYSKFFKLFEKSFKQNTYGFIGINQHKPSSLQLLKNPHFRIFISNENNFEKYDELKQAIKEQCYFFTPYLGQSEFLCSINYIDEIESYKKELNNESQKIMIHSIIPQDMILQENDVYQLDLSSDTLLIVEQMPENYEKEITIFNKFVYDKNTRAIKAKVKYYYPIDSNKLREGPINITLF